MNRLVNTYDEALVLEGASRVSLGAVPHRDFYANYGPAQFYVIGGLFKAFGPSVLLERAWDTVVRSGIVTVSFVFLRLASSRWEGLVAAGVVLIWMAALQYYGFPLFPSLLFSLIAGACLVPVLKGERSDGLLFASGVSLGLTVLFRYDVGFYAFLSISVVIAASAFARPEASARRLADAMRLLAPCWLGLAIICVPVAIFYATHNVLKGFDFDIIYFPTHFYAKMRGLPFPSLRAILHKRDLAAIYLPPFLWVCAALIAKPILQGRDRAVVASRLVLLLLGLMSALFYLKGYVRVAVVHMSLSIVPALLIGVLCLRYLKQPVRAYAGRPAFLVLLIGVVFAGLTTLSLLGLVRANAKNNLHWALHGEVWKTAAAGDDQIGSCRPGPGLERLACFETDIDRARAISYIAANSQKTDAIFEGVPHHDKFVANDMLIYFATGRRPATTWYHFDPGIQTSSEIQSEMITELKESRPRFVVIDASSVNLTEPNDSAISSGVTLLDNFIAANYHRVESFGQLSILQINGG